MSGPLSLLRYLVSWALGPDDASPRDHGSSRVYLAAERLDGIRAAVDNSETSRGNGSPALRQPQFDPLVPTSEL